MKNPTISEGGISRAFGSIRRIYTAQQGSDELIPWVPADDVARGTKSITENGVYQASADGVFAWSEVSVNVSTSGGVTGTGSDSEPHYISPDPNTGQLVDIVVPSSIVIETPPSVLTYADGQSISKDGMVVKAYRADGELWTDESHPDGVIPIGELELSPTAAFYSEFLSNNSSGYSDFGQGPWPNPLIYTTGMVRTQNRYSEQGTFLGHCEIELNGSGYIAVLLYDNGIMREYICCSDSPGSKYRFNSQIESQWPQYGDWYSISNTYTYNGKTVYYAFAGSGYNFETANATNMSVSSSGGGLNSEKAAWTIVYGDPAEPTDTQEITVLWPRSGDGAVLSDTFTILVTPPISEG